MSYFKLPSRNFPSGAEESHETCSKNNISELRLKARPLEHEAGALTTALRVSGQQNSPSPTILYEAVSKMA